MKKEMEVIMLAQPASLKKEALKEAFENIVGNSTTNVPAIDSGALLEDLQKALSPQIQANLDQVAQANGFSVGDLLRFAVIFYQLTFVAPAATLETLDILSQAWLEKQPELLQQLPIVAHFAQPEASVASVPEPLKQLFWENIEAAELNLLIERIAALQASMDTRVQQAYIDIMVEQEGAKGALSTGFERPAGLTLASLASCSPNTLGYTFYHQLVDNNFELDFIKERRGDIFADSRANYIGLRVYQTHDIWHVLLGYGVSGLDEVGLQAFQLAQVGSPSAAILLTLFLTRSILSGSYGLRQLLKVIFQGWQHGRQTIPMLAVKWEELWEQPLDEIRQRYRIQVRNKRLEGGLK
jgi:ubiquinone biosynthesis protein Coq4